jgi:hypothetical protein
VQDFWHGSIQGNNETVESKALALAGAVLRLRFGLQRVTQFHLFLNHAGFLKHKYNGLTVKTDCFSEN